MPDLVHVLVVDPEPGILERLAAAIPRRSAISVIGRVDDERSASQALADGVVDLVVVSIDRADGRGCAVIRAVADGGSGRVLAASRRVGPDVAVEAIGAGACGVIALDDGPSIADALRRALAGELILPDDGLSALVDHLASGAGHGHVVGSLTTRERDILRTFAAGASTAEVAEAFGISPLTVQSHVKNILAKLGVHSRVEAVRLAWRHGIVPAPASARG
jgi:DNA-binding NarL/FixJ family response regulator